MGLTKQLAQFTCQAKLDDFPSEVMTTAKGGILDCVGVMLAGSREPLATILVNLTQQLGGTPQSTVVGHAFKTSAPYAALVNGAMGHALDYDDITRLLKGHPSVVFVPPVLAVGEAMRATGRDILLAYIIGFEVGCAVGTGMGVDYADDLGWHPTAPLGTLGAATAAARLFGLNEAQATAAIAIAASQASGLRENFGTMTKPFHAGHAAQSGVLAAMLAQGGYTASSTVIEGRFGFMHAFSGGRGYDVDRVTSRLGKQFAILEPGIDVKKYPCCGSTHLALDAIFDLLATHDIKPAHVHDIEVRVDFDPPRSLIHADPQTPLQGKFSMQYCIATALLDRHVGLGSFSETQVHRPEARELMKKIRMLRNPGYEGRPSWEEARNEVQVRLNDDQVLTQRVARNYNGSLRGATPAELARKYRDCAALVLSDANVETSLEMLTGLEELEQVSRLMDTLSGA
jgi:2-methylcitrate dehydratase PrpD